MQSGNALAGFAYQEWNQKMAAELARQLGSNTTSPKEMADSFRRASTTEILAANLRMIQANVSGTEGAAFTRCRSLLSERKAERLGIRQPSTSGALRLPTLQLPTYECSHCLPCPQPKLQLGYPAFGPSPERRTSGAEAKFLAQDPESLLLEPQVPPVPTVAGISGQEGYFAYYFGGRHHLSLFLSHSRH